MKLWVPELSFLACTLLNAHEIKLSIKRHVWLISKKSSAKGRLQDFLHFGGTEEDPKWILSGLMLLFLQRVKGSFNPSTLQPELRLHTLNVPLWHFYPTASL